MHRDVCFTDISMCLLCRKEGALFQTIFFNSTVWGPWGFLACPHDYSCSAPTIVFETRQCNSGVMCKGASFRAVPNQICPDCFTGKALSDSPSYNTYIIFEFLTPTLVPTRLSLKGRVSYCHCFRFTYLLFAMPRGVDSHVP